MARNAKSAQAQTQDAVSALDRRLKAVLDGLAAASLRGEPVDARGLLLAAVEAVPFDEHEAFLLSGGIPRGHKALTTATAKLVKAGWMVKGRSGWTITEEGLRATVAFPTAQDLGLALAAGTPVPAGTELPAAPELPAEAEPPAETLPAETRPAETRPAEPEPARALEATAAIDGDQPESVAIAGDFGTHLGAPADWEPRADAVQMGLDSLSRTWVRTVDLPAGHYRFKIALNRSWDENYGAFGTFDGANHEVAHDGGPLTIAYDHTTKDVAFS